MPDGAAEGNIKLILMLGRLGSQYLGAGGGGLRRSLGEEVPGIEGGIANVVDDGAVEFVGAGLDDVVLHAKTLELNRRTASDHLKLVDGIDGDSQRHGAVVALLRDGGKGNAVHIHLIEIAIVGAFSIEGSGAAAALHARHEIHECCWVSLLSVHGERQGGVLLVLHGFAEGAVSGVERGRSSGDCDLLSLRAHFEMQIEAGGAGGVYGDMLLQQDGEAFGDHLDGVFAGRERRDGVVASARGLPGLLDAGGLIDGRDGGQWYDRPGLIDHPSLDGSLTTELRDQSVRVQKCKREGDEQTQSPWPEPFSSLETIHHKSLLMGVEQAGNFHSRLQ